jgi:hypothetical protein
VLNHAGLKWITVSSHPVILDVPSVLCPDEGSPSLLFRDRAVSTLLSEKIEMVAGLRCAPRGRMASLLGGAERAEAATRRLKPPVLMVPADVNPSSPSSIGSAASSGGQAAIACRPVAPVAFPAVQWLSRPNR